MKRPEAGLCLECHFVRMRDGDTAEVKLREGGLTWAVRLLDCWSTDHTAADKEGKKFAEQALAESSPLYLWVPKPGNLNNLLKNLTFDRVLGYLFVTEDQTINELLVAEGFATKAKPPKGPRRKK